MINGKRVLAMIPARGGSKGIKDKNIIDICGKPLIAYTIEAAKKCDYIDTVFVSTDSEKIRDVALLHGAYVPFLRDEEYAQDTSTTLDAIRNSLDKLKGINQEYDVMILLQPTSPLRDSEDIKGALEKFIECECESLVAVSEVNESPILIRQMVDEKHMDKLVNVLSTVRRQDMPKYYIVNGSIYINLVADIDEKTSFNDNKVPFVIEQNHAVDIDDYADVEMVKYYLKNC